MQQSRLSLIIPCFNEEAVINELYRRISRTFLDTGITDHEIVFIDDGSTDRTFEMVSHLALSDKNVRVIKLSRNFGHQNAVVAGFNNISGDLAIIMDADLQDPPEVIPEMIKQMKDTGCDVVYAVRKDRKGDGLLKRLTASIFYRALNRLSDTDLPLDSGDFKLVNKRVIEEFKALKEKNKYIRGLISWLGFRQQAFYFDRMERFAGRTKYNLPRMIKLALNGIMYFTTRPLRIALNLGFFSILIGLILTFWVVCAKITGSIATVPGWASTMIMVIFFGGIQLLTVGVIGIYIGSIFDEVKNRPEYIIDTRINF
jgi:polyisoprenyl-phosphate glycosyltransferase